MVIGKQGAEQMEDWQNGGFGLYLHWPFCQSKCPYCDFNSHVAESIDHYRWVKAYQSEIARLGRETSGRVLQTVYFGGGTPSLMRPDMVAEIVDTIRATWPMSNAPEITLEANPGSVEAAKFRAFREAGINRISMGMQAMNDSDLRRLGRTHTAAEAFRAFEIARSTFDRVNFDLIYGRQDQTLADWEKELATAIEMAADHLSLYQLTVEDGTVFAARNLAGKLRGLPGEDLSAEMFERTQEITAAAALFAYEVSNHAAPGAESRHNLIYWRGGDYVGIGPGAHGRLTLSGIRLATECHRSPQAWLSAVEAEGSAELPRVSLSGEDQALEYLMMGIRVTEGIELKRLMSMSATTLDQGAMRDLHDQGFIALEGDRLKATNSGRLVLNEVIRKLVNA